MFRNRRTAVVVLGAAAFGAFAFASPAAADVTATPSEATRGDGAKVTFQLPEERPGAYTTKIELVAPEANPVAEIYPMSADEWAPQITMRKLAQPIPGLHGLPISEATASITWTRFTGAPKPGAVTEVAVSMGPMPQQGNQVVFTLVQTYSDGTVVRWADPPAAEGGPKPAHPAVVVKLVGQAAQGNHHGGNAEQADPAAASTEDSGDGGGAYGILAAGLLAGLGLGVAGGWLILRNRRTQTPATTTEEPAEPKAKATAGAS